MRKLWSEIRCLSEGKFTTHAITHMNLNIWNSSISWQNMHFIFFKDWLQTCEKIMNWDTVLIGREIYQHMQLHMNLNIWNSSISWQNMHFIFFKDWLQTCARKLLKWETVLMPEGKFTKQWQYTYDFKYWNSSISWQNMHFIFLKIDYKLVRKLWIEIRCLSEGKFTKHFMNFFKDLTTNLWEN